MKCENLLPRANEEAHTIRHAYALKKRIFLYLKKVSYQHFWKLVNIDNSLAASRKINWAFHVSREIPVSKPVESTLANYRKLSKAPVIKLVIT